MKNIIFLALLLTSCAMKAPVESARIESKLNVEEATVFLTTQAKKCWSRNETHLNDGVKVISAKNKIEISRFARDIGVQSPFVTINVIEKDAESLVVVLEGDFACRLTGSCYQLNYTSEIRNWMFGNLSCETET